MSGQARPGGVMRFLVAPQYYQELLARPDTTPDCYVRPGQYPHHLYIDGVKYTVAQAVAQGPRAAQAKHAGEGIRPLHLHQAQFALLADQARRDGLDLGALEMLGAAPPTNDDAGPVRVGGYTPQPPK